MMNAAELTPRFIMPLGLSSDKAAFISHRLLDAFAIAGQKPVQDAVDELGRMRLPKRLASSTASLMATRPGVSVYRISKAPSRSTLRSVAAIRSRPQLSAVRASRRPVRPVAADAGHRRPRKLGQVVLLQTRGTESVGRGRVDARVQVVLKQDLQARLLALDFDDYMKPTQWRK